MSISISQPDVVGISVEADPSALKIASNLSDLNNATTARTNLGLGTMATQASSSYALLTGATFTGKVSGTSVAGAGGINIGIGGTNAGTVAGDLWISTGGTSMSYKDASNNWRTVANIGSINVFSTNQIIDCTSNTLAALRVTQKGSGNAIEVEDGSPVTPDSSAFIVNADGQVIIKGQTAFNSSVCLTTNGDIALQSITTITNAGPFNGYYPFELQVVINGVTAYIPYRV